MRSARPAIAGLVFLRPLKRISDRAVKLLASRFPLHSDETPATTGDLHT